MWLELLNLESMAMMLVALPCTLAAGVGGVWLLMLAFRRSALWGIATLVIPFGVLLYGLVHWREARTPFLLAAVPLTVMTGAMGLLLVTAAGSLLEVEAANAEFRADYEARNSELLATALPPGFSALEDWMDDPAPACPSGTELRAVRPLTVEQMCQPVPERARWHGYAGGEGGCPRGFIPNGEKRPSRYEMWCEATEDGSKHGPYVRWHSDGSRRQAGVLVRGDAQGEWIRWSTDGDEWRSEHHLGEEVPEDLTEEL